VSVTLSASLVNPTSVMLSWEYDGAFAQSGGANFIIYWKNNTPQGQSWKKLGVTSENEYQVSGLNWTTIYSFYVAAHRYTDAYGETVEISNVVQIFCQCGQGFEIPPENIPPEGPPSLYAWDQWQQSVDIQDGVVMFSCQQWVGPNYIYLFKIVDDTDWYFLGYYESDSTFQAEPQVRYVGDNVLICRPKYEFNPRTIAFQDGGFTEVQFDYYVLDKAVNGLCLNSSGRAVYIVRAPNPYPGDPYLYYQYGAWVSYNSGLTYGVAEDIIYFPTYPFISTGYASYDEADDGNIWIAVNVQSASSPPPYTYANNIYKYRVGSGCTFVQSFGTNVKTNRGYCYAEGTKIVYSYVEMNVASGTPRICISTDNGASWNTKTITTAKTGDRYTGPVCLANGVILVQAPDNATGFDVGIHRSTDNGNTWSVVMTLDPSEWNEGYITASTMRSDGDDVVFTTCDLSKYPYETNRLAYLISHDAGATWSTVVAPPLNEVIFPEGVPINLPFYVP